MPKSQRHKKARVADFTKAKLKLGKGKQIAANATNTSFASRSIALPNQSLTESKDGPTSRRNHTLPELLVQARHYSPTVKKEALVEIHLLLTAYPSLLQPNLLALVAIVSHTLADATPTVRAACRAILELVFEQTSAATLASITQGLVFFTLSALSSLDEGVRIDALRVLDHLMEYVPDEVTRGYQDGVEVSGEAGQSAIGDSAGTPVQGPGAQVVQALLGMLRIKSAALQAAQGAFTSGVAGSDLSPRARLAVLSTLGKFLRIAMSPVASTSSAPVPWYLSASFDSPRAFDNFCASIEPRSAGSHSAPCYACVEKYDVAFSHELSAPSTSSLQLSSLGLVGSNTAAANEDSKTAPSLLALLHPTLLSSFLDAAPSAFSPSAPLLSTSSSSTQNDPDLELVDSVVAVARELYWRELGSRAQSASSQGADNLPAAYDDDWEGTKRRGSKPAHSGSADTLARASLVGLLGHAAAYFPFGADDMRDRSPEDEAKLTSLNLTFASLVSLVALTPGDAESRQKSPTASSTNKRRKADELDGKVQVMVSNVRDWVSMALRGQLLNKTHPMGQALTASDYSALEPTLWALLNRRQRRRSARQALGRSGHIVGTTEDDDAKDDDEEGQTWDLWLAVLDHYERSPSGGEVKKLAFGFISRVVLLQSDPASTSAFSLWDSQAGVESASRFVLTCPKYMWELGTKSPETTLAVTRFLHQVLRAQSSLDTKTSSSLSSSLAPPPPPSLTVSTLTSLAPSLSAVFQVAHPKKRGSVIRGPFDKLPFEVKRRVLGAVGMLRRRVVSTGDDGGGGGGKNFKAAAQAVSMLDGAVERVLAQQEEGEGAQLLREWQVIKMMA